MAPMGELLRNEGKLQACVRLLDVCGRILLKKGLIFCHRWMKTCLLSGQALKAPMARCKSGVWTLEDVPPHGRTTYNSNTFCDVKNVAYFLFFFPCQSRGCVGVLAAGERAGNNTELEIDFEESGASSAPRQHTGRCRTPPNRGDYTQNNG